MTDIAQRADVGRARVGVGIDFGTSNSAAAIFDGQSVIMVQLEQMDSIMPSANYIDREFIGLTGQQAIDTYIAGNQGRKVEMSLEVLGEARTSTGEMNMATELPQMAESSLVYGQAFNDGGLPGRLFRGTKRLLGSIDTQRIMVFGKAFRLVALVTPILLRIRKAVEQTVIKLGISPTDRACIGHPVNFEGRDKDHNDVALERLAESYRHAGIRSQSFYPEPTAATLSYLHAHPEDHRQRILTVDFGGGTLDLCVLERHGARFEVQGIHGVGLGGDHIDQCMFTHILLPLLGKGERWRRTVDGEEVETPFPFHLYESYLLNWTVSYMLNQNQFTTPVLDKIAQGGDGREKFERLYELITQNCCYQVFQAIKECKAALSDADEVLLDIPDIDVSVMVTRHDFEAMISEQLAVFEQAVLDTLRTAGLESDDIELVIRTGGSSLIPAFKHILEQHFPGKVVEHDPFTSVAAGLAIADYQGLADLK